MCHYYTFVYNLLGFVPEPIFAFERGSETAAGLQLVFTKASGGECIAAMQNKPTDASVNNYKFYDMLAFSCG